MSSNESIGESKVSHELESEGEKSAWGGKREGAGRPPKGDELLSERVFFRLTATQYAKLKTAQEDGESVSMAARRLLLESLGLDGRV